MPITSTPVPVTGHTGLTCLLGSPVAHSLSPRMHNRAFALLGLDLVYLCFDVKEEALAQTVAGLRQMHVRGFNLTMPDKTRMASLCDALSPAARLIGAVNTVVHESGRLTGHNTDGTGFFRSAAELGFSVFGKHVTVLGAGGAATAICAQAALDGAASLCVFARPTSRFHAKNAAFIKTLNAETACACSLLDLQDAALLSKTLETTDLLIQATPVGMAPKEGESLLEDFSPLPKEALVADIIYNPRETRFMKLAKAAGLRTMNGLYMLLYQGAEAFRLWTGQEMPTEIIKKELFC